MTIIDEQRSRTFNRMWLSVCELEEQAKASKTATAYDCYLSADIQLRALLAKWEAEDLVFGQITGLLEAFYAEQEMQTNPARLLVKRLHPGTYRIEPGFSLVVKELPDDLKTTYLARGQAEMQAFTSYSWNSKMLSLSPQSLCLALLRPLFALPNVSNNAPLFRTISVSRKVDASLI